MITVVVRRRNFYNSKKQREGRELQSQPGSAEKRLFQTNPHQGFRIHLLAPYALATSPDKQLKTPDENKMDDENQYGSMPCPSMIFKGLIKNVLWG